MLREHLSHLIPDLTDSQLVQFDAHYDLLMRWNRKLNLTRIESPREAAERHYAESVFLARHLPAGKLRIVDIGSGGGFPGIPVAIIRPEIHVTLVESHQRKAVFLKEATRDMPNVTVLPVRAETITDSYDWLVARAVSWEDLRSFAGHLAPALALLTGSEPIPSETSRISLPWGDRRFLVLVSRET